MWRGFSRDNNSESQLDGNRISTINFKNLQDKLRQPSLKHYQKVFEEISLVKSQIGLTT